MRSITTSAVAYEMLQEISKKQNKRPDIILEALIKQAYSQIK